MKKWVMFPMNESDNNSNKIDIFSNPYLILEIKKKLFNGLDVYHQNALNSVPSHIN